MFVDLMDVYPCMYPSFVHLCASYNYKFFLITINITFNYFVFRIMIIPLSITCRPYEQRLQ